MSLPRNIVAGEYYHVYNRGAHQHGVFRTQADYARFLFYVLYFQSPALFKNISRVAHTFSADQGFQVDELDFANVLSGRYVELVAFCLMPNHFHCIVRPLADDGLERFMQRIQDAYTKYFHALNGSSGHVFEGRYKSKHINDNEYLTHLSAYIHRNPRELKTWKGHESEYPWSSYRDYVTENRWGGLLAQEMILDQFEGTRSSNYADFVKTSPAKGFDFELID